MTRKAVYGMLRAAPLSGALFLAAGAIPLVGGIAALFSPAPILTYALGKPGVTVRVAGSIACATLLIALVAGPIASLAYLVSFGFATALMSYLLVRRQPFELIVICTAATLLVAATVAALLFAGSPDALIHTMRSSFEEGMLRGQRVYGTLGIDTGIAAETRAKVLDAIITLSPALVALSAAMATVLNLAVFWRWTGKQSLAYTLFGDLGKWSAPEWLIWVLIATGFALFIPSVPVYTIALNTFICVAAVYFCQGLAILSFYFKRHGMPMAVRGIVYLLAIVQPVVAALVCAAGVFDMWVDFRRLKPPSQEAGSFGDFF